MIYPETYYSAKCDNCGELWSDDYNGISAYCDKYTMLDHLEYSGWHITKKEKHYCPKCYGFDGNNNLVLIKPIE